MHRLHQYRHPPPGVSVLLLPEAGCRRTTGWVAYSIHPRSCPPRAATSDTNQTSSTLDRIQRPTGCYVPAGCRLCCGSTTPLTFDLRQPFFAPVIGNGSILSQQLLLEYIGSISG